MEKSTIDISSNGQLQLEILGIFQCQPDKEARTKVAARTAGPKIASDFGRE